MRAVDLIAKKRLGGEHSDSEINYLINGYVAGAVPDYQMSAWLMAVLWQGLTDAETFVLTSAMVASGDVLDLSGVRGVSVDKHSTGGVGDKTTLAVVPILASAGVPVAKMSGRGLGHTGGTIDKLESIAGLRTRLTSDEILTQVRTVGACICAQTERLVPADQKLYALRDATSTVESLPLIAASIMSKKIAGGSRAIVLDVKVGGGAFMKNLAEARALASLMVKIGQAHGQRVVAVLSNMNAPLGRCVGNRLEVEEVCKLLQNDPGAEPHLKELVCYLAAVGFVIAGRAATLQDGQILAESQLASGAAFDKICDIIAAQGGDAAMLRKKIVSPVAFVTHHVLAERGGYIVNIDAQAIGLAAMRLGAGRATKEDTIDPTAGIILHASLGAAVTKGDRLATLQTNRREIIQEAAEQIRQAVTLADEPQSKTPLIYETIGL